MSCYFELCIKKHSNILQRDTLYINRFSKEQIHLRSRQNFQCNLLNFNVAMNGFGSLGFSSREIISYFYFIHVFV